MLQLGPYLNLGWQLAITIIVMVFLGKWLDAQFDTSPWMIVCCSIFGVFAGMYTFIKTVITLDKKKKK